MHSTLTRAKRIIFSTGYNGEVKRATIHFLKLNKIYCISTQYKLVIVKPKSSLPFDFIAYGIYGLRRFLLTLLYRVSIDSDFLVNLLPTLFCQHNYVDGSDGEFKVGRRCYECEIPCC
jgi:hypothetical protein